MDSPASSVSGGREAEEFNNTKSKKTFLKLIKLHFNTSMFKEKRRSIHLAETSEEQIKLINLEPKIKRNEIYKITENDGKKVITIRDKSNIYREIMPFSGIYDVLMELHVENDHNITLVTKTETEAKYLIPSICFDIIPDACNVCRNKPVRATGASRNGIVSFIHNMKMNRNSSDYNSILIYLDEYSEYVVLRPTKSRDHFDVSTEIFKIFMQFGPPERVCIVLKDPEMVDPLSKIMQNLCPTCKTTFKFTDDDQIMLYRVMEAIGVWMKEASSDYWEMGCLVVQHRLNTLTKTLAPSGNMPVTAHNLFFNLLSTVNPADSDSDDEPLIFVKEMNATEKDPLSIDISKLNIQDKSNRRSSRLKKTIKYRDGDTTHTNEKIKSNKKKKNKVERPFIEIPLTYETEDNPIKHEVFIERNEETEVATSSRKKEYIDSSDFLDKIEGTIKKFNLNKKKRKPSKCFYEVPLHGAKDKKNPLKNIGFIERTEEAENTKSSKKKGDTETVTKETITLEITEIVETTGKDDQASTSASGKTTEENVGDDGDDDIDIDFGAEI